MRKTINFCNISAKIDLIDLNVKMDFQGSSFDQVWSNVYLREHILVFKKLIEQSVSSLCTGRFEMFLPYFGDLTLHDLYHCYEHKLINDIPHPHKLLALVFVRNILGPYMRNKDPFMLEEYRPSSAAIKFCHRDSDDYHRHYLSDSDDIESD
jgi:hypothetical protein